MSSWLNERTRAGPEVSSVGEVESLDYKRDGKGGQWQQGSIGAMQAKQCVPGRTQLG